MQKIGDKIVYNTIEEILDLHYYHHYNLVDSFALIVMMIISMMSFSDQLNCFCEIC
jgi:hypothetical protein